MRSDTVGCEQRVMIKSSVRFIFRFRDCCNWAKHKCTKRRIGARLVCTAHKNKLIREGWKAVKL